MRIITRKHIKTFCKKHSDVEQALNAWFDEVSAAKWGGPQDVKKRYPTASFLANNRIVFNIKGNHYRLIIGVSYTMGAVYIKFLGTHKEYDRVDAVTVEME